MSDGRTRARWLPAAPRCPLATLCSSMGGETRAAPSAEPGRRSCDLRAAITPAATRNPQDGGCQPRDALRSASLCSGAGNNSAVLTTAVNASRWEQPQADLLPSFGQPRGSAPPGCSRRPSAPPCREQPPAPPWQAVLRHWATTRHSRVFPSRGLPSWWQRPAGSPRVRFAYESSAGLTHQRGEG